MHTRGVKGAAAIALAAMLASACGVNRAYRRGEAAVQAGDLDTAVTFYRRAVQEDPDKPEYKIALERAQAAASIQHFNRGKELESKGDFETAIAEYRRAVEFDPGNRQAAFRRAELERAVREKAEASRAPAAVDAMRARARQATQPELNPASREPLKFVFNESAATDVLNFLGATAGINIVYEPSFKAQAASKPITLNADSISFEEALNLVMTMSGSWYKVINPRTIFVMPDTPQMRQKYEEQVVRTFYLSHADAQEMNQVVQQVGRLTTPAAGQVVAVPNKTANTITVRGSAALVNIIEKVIQANDRPRAEIVIDVEILEVSRERTKELGLNLSNYNISTIFSPESRPGGGGDGDGDGDDDGGGQAPTGGLFNLNTISRGVSMADFYMTVPSAVFNFLASDGQSRLLAKPQLRGAEGEELSLNIGNDVPIPRTTFGGVAAGGINTVPIQSFEYRTVGIIVTMKPRVTFENEIVLDITVENSTVGQPSIIAGQELPTFGTRKVKTRLRLREGESNLLAGLLQEEETQSLSGFPGLLRVPVLKEVLSGRSSTTRSTDIVMLLTPRLVRTHELTQEHLNPIHIGSSANIGLTGPSPVIAVPPDEAVGPAAGPAPAPIGPQPPPPGGIPPAPQPALPGGQTSTPGMPPAGVVPQTSTPGQQPPPPTQPPPQPPAGQPTTTPPPTVTPGAPGTPPATEGGVPATPGAPGAPATAPSATPPRSPATPPGGTQAAGTGAAPVSAPAQIIVATPGPELRVGSGPYTVPISVSGASRLSVLSVSLTFNPAVVRVRSVQEGTFMRQGGVAAPFSHKIDPAGRVDISFTRGGDQTGASGTGLLAAILVDPIAPGGNTFAVSGVATTPDGAAAPLSFTPASVTVR